MDVIDRIEPTPNPNSRRFVLRRPVQEQAKGRFFMSANETDEPLAKALFAVDGVSGVLFLPNSVTVSKSNEAEWEALEPNAGQVIESYFA